MNALVNFIKDEDGVTTIEYVLLAAGIAVVVLAVAGAMNPALANRLTAIITGVAAPV